MPKILDPFICEICSTPKKPSNGWFLGRVVNPGMEDVCVKIVKWDNELAEDEAGGIKHLCGIDCASRWFVKELAKVYESKPFQNGEGI